MSARHCRGYRSQADWLPADTLALRLEAQGLWLRAATRWQQVLLAETDDRVMEAILQQHDNCLRQGRHRARAGEDAAQAAGGVAEGMTWLPHGLDIWRTA